MSDPRIHCYTEDIKTANEKLKNAKPSDLGYIFVADLHNGAYLLQNEEGHLTFYEDDDTVALKEARLIAQLDAIAEIAKNNDNIDFICVGGDIIRTLATIKQIENLVEYVNNTDEIDFVAIGGDTIQGTQNKTTSLGYFKKAFTPFLSCNKPVVIVPGNHDDNSYAYNTKTFDGSWLITDKDWNDKIIDIYVKLARVEPDTPSKQNFR